MLGAKNRYPTFSQHALGPGSVRLAAAGGSRLFLFLVLFLVFLFFILLLIDLFKEFGGEEIALEGSEFVGEIDAGDVGRIGHEHAHQRPAERNSTVAPTAKAGLTVFDGGFFHGKHLCSVMKQEIGA